MSKKLAEKTPQLECVVDKDGQARRVAEMTKEELIDILNLVFTSGVPKFPVINPPDEATDAYVWNKVFDGPYQPIRFPMPICCDYETVRRVVDTLKAGKPCPEAVDVIAGNMALHAQTSQSALAAKQELLKPGEEEEKTLVVVYSVSLRESAALLWPRAARVVVGNAVPARLFSRVIILRGEGCRPFRMSATRFLTWFNESVRTRLAPINGENIIWL